MRLMHSARKRTGVDRLQSRELGLELLSHALFGSNPVGVPLSGRQVGFPDNGGPVRSTLRKRRFVKLAVWTSG
jgi:hypothetical protein